MLIQYQQQPQTIFSVLYHPPGLSKKLKNDTISHIKSTAAKHFKKHPSAERFICGDFNHLDSKLLTTLIPVQQKVNFPTRNNARLDLVFIDTQEYIDNGCREKPPALENDHLAIEVPSTYRHNPAQYTSKHKPLITPASIIKLSIELSTLDWFALYGSNSADEKAEILHQSINTLFSKHCPSRSIRVHCEKPVIIYTSDWEAISCQGMPIINAVPL